MKAAITVVSTSNIDMRIAECRHRAERATATCCFLTAENSRGQSAIHLRWEQTYNEVLRTTIYPSALRRDDRLSVTEADSVRDHLLICPLCRQRNDDLREIRSQLRSIRRREMSSAVSSRRMNDAVRSRVRRENVRLLPIGAEVRDWLTFNFMPYAEA